MDNVGVRVADGKRARWPELTLSAWRETMEELQPWFQIVGKVRLALAPMVNHWLQVPLYFSFHGLTTSLMRADGRGIEMG